MGESNDRIFEFGTWRLDRDERRLTCNGVPVPLTPKVFETLLVLLENAGTLVSKETFMKRIWPDTCVEDLALVQNISQLRKALANGSERAIETVSKRGYRFVLPVRTIDRDKETHPADSLATANHRPQAAVAPSTGRAAFEQLAAEEKSPPGSQETTTVTLPREETLGKVHAAPPIEIQQTGPKAARSMPAHNWVIIGLAGLLVASAWLAWHHHRAASNAGLSEVHPVMVPLLDLSGDQKMPALSPDGSRIAFVRQTDQEGKTGIYVEVVGSQSLVQITSNGSDSEPVWSPDGRTIAFLRNSDRRFQIVLVPALGGREKHLYSGTPIPFASPTSLSFSISGDKLAFADWEDAAQKSFIKVLNLSDLRQLTLTTPPVGYHDCAPEFSPDGSLVAFVRSTGPMFVDDLYVVSSNGGTPRRVTSDRRRIFSAPVWSGEGRELLFSSTHAGMKSLWSVPVAGGELMAVPGSGPGSDHPTFSAVTHELAYENTVEDENVWHIALNPSNETKAAAQALFSSRTSNLMPQFSPDGKRVLFESDRSGYEEIWISNSDGSNPIQITKLERYAGSPSWSPDGNSIAFDFRSSLHSGIYTLALEGAAAPRPVALFSDADSVVPSWSGDGQWIYFASNHGKTGFHVWKVMANGEGEPVQVTQGEGFKTVEAQDRHSLYYTRLADPRLRQRAVDTGSEILLEGQPTPDRWANWTIGDHGIYFIESKSGVPSHLKFTDTKTKHTTTLFTLSKPSFYGLSVSRDGKFAIYSQSDRNEHDIVLLGGFQ